MKTLFSFSFFFLCVFVVNAQVELHYNGQLLGNDLHKLDIDATGSLQINVEIVNLGAMPIVFRHSRTRLSHVPGWQDNTHDEMIGWAIGDVDYWISLAGAPMVTVDPGDSSTLALLLYPLDIEGCATYRYKIVDEFEQAFDSLDVHYGTTGAVCNLSSVEIENKNVAVYPNPSSGEVVFIENAPAQTNYVVLNTLGQKVKEGPLNTQGTSINIGELDADTYIIQLLNAEGVVESNVRWIKL